MNQNNERLVFELNRLLSYEDADLVAEIRRVAGVVGERPLTAAEFDKHAKVHSSTVRKRFGGWAEALAAAGMRERYGGRPVSEKMKTQAAKGMLNGEIIAEMQQVALRLGKTVLTMEELNRESALINAK